MQGPVFGAVDRFPINDKWEYVMEPDATSGEVRRFFPREEILLNTRGQLMVRLRDELPPGLYRFRVVSQCTTNSIPLKKPLTYNSRVLYRIYPPGEEYVIMKEGKKI
nr:hypothetical protein [Parabacteroides goldsteinii]